MEEKDFIYDDKERGTIIYVGSNGSDGEDHTFNPSYFDELTNSGKYQEAKDYLNDYNYKDPKYYSKVQRLKDQCDTWILYNQHQYELAGEQNKGSIDFLKLYDNDYDNLNVSDNDLAKRYSKILSNMFGEADEISLNFDKTKQRFIFDAWSRDNNYNNIHAYKKRLAESMGMKSVSDSYLESNGIKISYGDYDGAGTIIVNKNSKYLKNILESVVNDKYEPHIYREYGDGKRESAHPFNDVNGLTKVATSTLPYRAMSYLDMLNNLVDGAKNVRNTSKFNDDYVAESINYPFQFYGSDALDVRIDTGGQTGSAAGKTRAEYERELIGAMRSMLPGFHDIRVFTGPKDIIQNDDYGLAQPLDAETQAKLFQLVTSADDNDIIPSLNITSDGRCGFTFTVNGKLGSKNVPQRDRIQFTVYNWNTDKINQLMDANPEYRAIRKINEISRYNGTYESLDGNYYKYIGGGYGADAIYEDGDGNRYNMSQMKDIRMRDDLVNEQVNNILARHVNRSGNYIGTNTANWYNELYDDEIIAASIYIGSQVIKQNPVDTKGRPLSVKEIANYLRRDYRLGRGDRMLEYTESMNGVNSYSYPILMYLRDIRDIVDDEIAYYYNQRYHNIYTENETYR